MDGHTVFERGHAGEASSRVGDGLLFLSQAAWFLLPGLLTSHLNALDLSAARISARITISASAGATVEGEEAPVGLACREAPRACGMSSRALGPA